MHIKTGSFNHDELRRSVIKLWRHRKALPRSDEGEQNRRFASQCQEDVARMLGMRSWSNIKKKIQISRQRQKHLQEKDLYPNHRSSITPEIAIDFMDWVQTHGVDFLFISSSRPITYYFPGETITMHKATCRNTKRHEIHALMQALSFQKDFIEKFHGSLHFSRMISVNQQEAVLWKGEFFQSEDYCFLQFKRRVTSSSVRQSGIRLPKEKNILLSERGLIIFIDPNLQGSRDTIQAAVDKRSSLLGGDMERFVYHVVTDPVSGPSERKSGRFRPSYGETSHCQPHMLDLMQGKGFVFVVQRCVESQMLGIATKVAQDAPVYLGICGSFSEDDIYLQRASNGLVRALQMFNENNWKDRAKELFSVLDAVVCSVPIGPTRVKEYLIFDDALRKQCSEELEKASTPMDMHLFFAAKIMEQKHGIIDDLIELGGNISDEGANFALSAERAWKSKIEKVCLNATTPNNHAEIAKVVRI